MLLSSRAHGSGGFGGESGVGVGSGSLAESCGSSDDSPESVGSETGCSGGAGEEICSGALLEGP